MSGTRTSRNTRVRHRWGLTSKRIRRDLVPSSRRDKVPSMRAHSWILALVCALPACRPPARPSLAGAPPDSPAPSPSIATSSARCGDTPIDPRAPRRAEILTELATLDAELDAIDGELAAAAQNQNRSLTDARVAALAYKSALDAVQLDGVPVLGANAPVLLTRAARSLLRAMTREQELSRSLGPRNPDMQRAIQATKTLRTIAQEQLANEHAFAQSWIDALAALPAKAKPDAVYDARLEAIRKTLATPSSESPANLRVAHETLRAARVAHDDLASYAGPKHPDMVRASAQLVEATTALDVAIKDADAALTARIAAPTRTPDGAAIARRSELADNARMLRDEYELLAR